MGDRPAISRAFLSAMPLVPADMLAAVAHPEHPGMAMFVGTVRDDAAIRPVAALEYEAFAEMAVSEMDAICDEAAGRHGARCALIHRTGVVDVGEASVVAAASAPSRAAAMAACEWVVDQLKARVPVWKLQRFADGGSEWSRGA